MVGWRTSDKRDANEAECIEEAMVYGPTCEKIRGSKGTPDLLGCAWSGTAYVAEVKDPARDRNRTKACMANDRLDPAQVEWRRRWRGLYFVWTCRADVVRDLRGLV